MIYDFLVRFLGGKNSAWIYSIGIFVTMFLSFVATFIKFFNRNLSTIIYFISALGLLMSTIFLIYRFTVFFSYEKIQAREMSDC